MNKLLISLLLTITILWGCEKNNPITNGKQIRVQQFEKELVLTGKPLSENKCGFIANLVHHEAEGD